MNSTFLRALTVLCLLALAPAFRASAHSITYSVNGAQGYGLSSIGATLYLPLFDPLSAAIPDNAVLLGVSLRIHDVTSGFVHIFNNTGEELTFSGSQFTTVLFNNLATGLSFTDSRTFPFSFASATGGLSFYIHNVLFEGGDSNLDAYKATPGGDSFFFLTKWASEGLHWGASPAPGPSLDDFPAITVLSEILNGHTTAEVTYTYGVPDSGMTLLLFGFALAALSSGAKVRAGRECRR